MQRICIAIVAMLLVSGGVTCDEPPTDDNAPHQPWSLPWWSIDGGGGPSIGGVYRLDGVIGQSDAGVMFAEDYVLVGGFFGGLNVGILFTDGFESGLPGRWSLTVGD